MYNNSYIAPNAIHMLHYEWQIIHQGIYIATKKYNFFATSTYLYNISRSIGVAYIVAFRKQLLYLASKVPF